MTPKAQPEAHLQSRLTFWKQECGSKLTTRERVWLCKAIAREFQVPYATVKTIFASVWA